jgi:ABC-2 type transport system ATP-binding protein
MVVDLGAISVPSPLHSSASAAPATAVAARVRGLTKKYGDIVAVSGIDFDIQPGEILALLGPNGSGKTTVVEILEGHRARDGGEVEVLGYDPATAPRRWYDRIGIVLQRSADSPDLTVREVLRHYSAYYTKGCDADEIIDTVGLRDCAHRRIYQLSGGQRRRLDVALGIVGRPELLFLDEPTTGFDPEARRGFWALVRRLASEGTSILLTTHYLEEAEALADRVAVLIKGTIVVSGNPATLAGRDSADACVSWLDETGRRVVHTQQPEKIIQQLMLQFDLIPELTVTRPSLEDVYLGLVRSHSNGDGEAS